MKRPFTVPAAAAIAGLILAAPVAAQTTGDTAPAADGAQTQSATAGTPQVGDFYIRNTFDDWRIRCVLTQNTPQDPCQMLQILSNTDGTDVAEISLVPVVREDATTAIASISTPLGTLLTAGLEISIDDSTPTRHPFWFCVEKGCNARIEMNEEGIDAMKSGAVANIKIVAVAQPPQPIDLALSLKGFTAAFDELLTINPGAIEPAEEAPAQQ